MGSVLERACKTGMAIISAVILAFAGLTWWVGAAFAAEDGPKGDGDAGLAEMVAGRVAEAFTPHGAEFGKNETVAVKTDLSGNLDSIAVEEWIKNPAGLESIRDASNLQNIVPDEEGVRFEQEGESIVWTANGDDVSYTGTLGRDLPFSLSYHYELDGVEVDPASLVDASGLLKIRIDYANNTRASVDVYGATREVQDPYVMVSLVSFDAEHARNVEVDNGLVVDQQGTLMAVGLAMPGLTRTLGLEDIAELPESVEIAAEVKGFDMPDITTIVTDQALGNIDADATGDIQGRLSDAIGQLGNISQGIDGLAKGNKGVSEAVGKISEGQAAMAANLPNATQGLQALAQLSDAASAAAKDASDKQAEIAENADGASESLARAIDGQQAAIAAQQQASAQQQAAVGALAGAASFDEPIALQDSALQALRAIDTDSMDDSQKSAVADAIGCLESALASTRDSADQTQEAIGSAASALGEAQVAGDEAESSLGLLDASLKASGEALDSNRELEDDLAASLAAAAEQTSSLSAGLTQASGGFTQVQAGMEQLSEALAKISEASGQLGKAAGKMSEGVSEAIGAVQSNIDGKVELVNALSAYVKAKPAFGGSAEDMPASTLYLVHATAEASPLR